MIRISIAAAAALEWYYLRNRKDGENETARI